MQQLYLSWVFQRRPESMQEYFGFEHVQLGYAFQSRRKRLIEYALKSAHSLGILIARCPDVIWVASPPTIILYLTFAYSLLRRRRPRVIVDCHNGTFRPRWNGLPFVRRLLRAADLVVVHNGMMREPAANSGVAPERVVVLEDKPAQIRPGSRHGAGARPLFVIPCSFDPDEPIAALLAAAARLPGCDFILTGKVERARGIHTLSNVPTNASCSGYLPKHEFERLVASATAVCGLTNLEGCQLCAASEAVGAGVPLVLSGTRLLRDLFSKGAVYVESNDADQIAHACETAAREQVRLRREMRELRHERLARWLEQARPVRTWIGSTDGHRPFHEAGGPADVDAELPAAGPAGRA